MRRTRKQMAALLARRDRDGVSLRRLAEESGVPIGTLAWWSWRLRQSGRGDGDGKSAGGFVELVEQHQDSRAAVVVVMPSGVRVEVAAASDLELLKSVVRALQSC